jgi:hypothetical protein
MRNLALFQIRPLSRFGANQTQRSIVHLHRCELTAQQLVQRVEGLRGPTWARHGFVLLPFGMIRVRASPGAPSSQERGAERGTPATQSAQGLFKVRTNLRLPA